MEKIQRLLDLCKGHPTYIQAHNFPDPDALASGYGLRQFLRRFGIPALFCYDGLLDKRACKKMTEVFHVEALSLRELGEIPDDSVLICVDSQKGAGNVTPLSVEVAACIDHHPTFIPAEYLYQDIRRAGSCASIISEYYKRAGIEPDMDTATALLYGIKIDTRQFSRGVTPLDIEMFQFLERYYDEERLHRVNFNTMMFADLKAYASAIENISVYGSAGFAEIDFPCSDDLIAMISDFFLTLDELDLSVAYSRREDGIKFSVRSEKKEVHAGYWVKLALAGLGSGGGHAYMGGGIIPCENIWKLGIYPEEVIRDRFLDAQQSAGSRE